MAILKNRLDPAKHAWLQAQNIAVIFDAIAAAGGTVRFVGGVVRDAMLGHAVGDVDLATNLPPQHVTEILTAAGLKVVPTGIEHGTVTVVVDHKGYEITTLRHDVETDGRRAKVAFTDDWQADAARRDFTFNALYADRDGSVHDYFKGGEDLATGQVRFIGDAEARIREDVLRILRFFRFYAWFGQGADAEGLAACRKLAGLLPQLSAERVWKEIGKLLLAPDPVPALALMQETGVLAQILPEATGLERLQRLVAVEQTFAGPDAVRRLAGLLSGEPVPSGTPHLTSSARGEELSSLPLAGRVGEGGAPQESVVISVAQRLKLSRREGEHLRILANLPYQLHGKTDAMPLRRVLYDVGAEAVRDGLLLLAADEAVLDLRTALAVVEAWDSPQLPVQGEDVLKLGIAAGPRVGEVLRVVENWWMEKDFRPTREECLAELQRLIK